MVNNDITLKQETTVELIMWCMLFAFCHHSCYILLCLFYFGCYHQFINMHNFCDNITVVIQHTVAYGSLCTLLLSIFMCVCVSVCFCLSLPPSLFITSLWVVCTPCPEKKRRHGIFQSRHIDVIIMQCRASIDGTFYNISVTWIVRTIRAKIIKSYLNLSSCGQNTVGPFYPDTVYIIIGYQLWWTFLSGSLPFSCYFNLLLLFVYFWPIKYLLWSDLIYKQ